MKFLVGIDEAGRGPLAGPVAVGVVQVPINFDWELVADATDSKRMSETAREDMYERMCSLQHEGVLHFAVGFTSATDIDTKGIVPSIHAAMIAALEELDLNPKDCEVRLDGSLKAPEEFLRQTTIIKGDLSEKIISLASIAAKVERDRLMIKMADKYPAYSFEIHKGYGTLAHRKSIQEQGICPEHRSTFCTRIIQPIASK